MNPERLTCEPIGYFFGNHSEKYMAPRQAELSLNDAKGVIVLNPGYNFEQALEDLAGFEHIWILYWFHRNHSWNPKVTTPRSGPKRGLFATRSPHRPNPIGLSCVPLLKIKGRELLIGKHDLLEGTPILDIKPYLVYADAFPTSKQGWIENIPLKSYTVHWTPLALEQAKFIERHQSIPLCDTVNLRLSDSPFPFKNHRIKQIDANRYELALKTWRLHYEVNEYEIVVQTISSGYDQETLEGKKESQWKDLPFHQLFIRTFDR
jgi:tRNA (adenine37-N6)-methyltransferase